MTGHRPGRAADEEAYEEAYEDTAVAVVGMAGRFGGADDLDAFWRRSTGLVSGVRRLTGDELRAAGEPAYRLADPGYVPYHAVIDDADAFDADLFGYPAREAVLIDPQHRLFLECCWHALEDAGRAPTSPGGVVGVYGGCGENRYRQLLRGSGPAGGFDDYQIMLGTAADHLCLRVSHKLRLTGPSMTVLSTCSTSLVAVHQACRALLAGDCDLALAGGASVRVPPHGVVSRDGSPAALDGVYRAFHAAGQGGVSGDGVGVVVLQRLVDARADGSHIYAVIRGSAVNNDGGDRAGYAVPGVAGRASVIATALAEAGVVPDTVGYVEGHGTGAPTADAIELAALARAYGPAAGGPAPDPGACVLGTVKPLIGHTGDAAGVAGLIHACLALHHRTLPGTAHIDRPHPALAGSPFRVPGAAQPWADGGHRRRAGVSAFGAGGTNAHVVLEEAPPPPPRAAPGPAAPAHRLLVLSAQSRGALAEATRALADHLTERPHVDLDDVAYTLQVGRAALPHRWCAVVTDHADARQALTRTDHDGFPSGTPVTMIEAARRWLAGGPVDERDPPGAGRRRVRLPRYPFQRRRYGVDA
jgi:acyl transferase domain-containing protein